MHQVSLTAMAWATAVLMAAESSTLASDVAWVNVTRDGGRVDIHSKLVINAPITEVYAALLSYDQFDQMGDTFAESRYLEPDVDGSPRVYTRTEGCIWFFCKTIERTARLELEPQQKIIAIAEPENSDAALSIETWTLSVVGESTVIEYTHEIDTGFWVPPLIGSLIINRSVETGTRKAARRIEYLALGNNKQTLAYE